MFKMFCPHCGEKIDANAKFCPKCGKNVHSSHKSINFDKKNIDDTLNNVKDSVHSFMERDDVKSGIHKINSTVDSGVKKFNSGMDKVSKGDKKGKGEY